MINFMACNIIHIFRRKVALEFLKASISMVRRILEVLMEKLGVTLEESRIDGLIGLKMVNMNFYPTCPNPDLTVGVGRHSDMGTLTMLLQDGIGILYVKMEEDITSAGKKGEWVEIPPIPGALVINVGDTLQVRLILIYLQNLVIEVHKIILKWTFL